MNLEQEELFGSSQSSFEHGIWNSVFDRYKILVNIVQGCQWSGHLEISDEPLWISSCRFTPLLLTNIGDGCLRRKAVFRHSLSPYPLTFYNGYGNLHRQIDFIFDDFHDESFIYENTIFIEIKWSDESVAIDDRWTIWNSFRN